MKRPWSFHLHHTVAVGVALWEVNSTTPWIDVLLGGCLFLLFLCVQLWANDHFWVFLKHAKDARLDVVWSQWASKHLGEPVKVMCYTSKRPNAVTQDGLERSIWISTGMQSHLTQAEIEGVLAHELSHLKRRHARTQVRWLVATDVSLWLFWSFSAWLWGRLAPAFNPDFIDSSTLAWMGLWSIWALSFVASRELLCWKSRTQEMEADRLALTWVSPNILKAALSQLKPWAEESPSRATGSHQWATTHPSIDQRIQRLDRVNQC
jgi:Zn-dependent protease with chaperone function